MSTDIAVETKIARSTTLGELFGEKLRIPDFQRPYKWDTKQVELMLNDIQESLEKKPELPYMMGTVIVHPAEDDEGKEWLDIVDGQQRLTTLTLLARVLQPDVEAGLTQQKYAHLISQKNLKTNFKSIQDWLKAKGIEGTDAKEFREFVMGKIAFVLVKAPTLDDAFVFFDSQNSRGKPLSPHDLLKAHHLRYIASDDLAKSCVIHWEAVDKQKTEGHDRLAYLTETILGRSRKWIKKEYRGLDLLKEFKSQRVSKRAATSYRLNRYQQPAVFESWSYNQEAQKNDGLELKMRDVDVMHGSKRMQFLADSKRFMPFQLPQSLEGGEHFFWYIEKYDDLFRELFEAEVGTELLAFRELYGWLHWYSWNTGIRYIMEVFQAAMLFYYDKFGTERIEEVSMWMEHGLFYLRHRQSSVRSSSIPKYIRDTFNPFVMIDKAAFPDHLIASIKSEMEGLYAGLDRSFVNEKKSDGNLRNTIRQQLYDGLYGAKGYYRKVDLPKSIELPKTKLLKVQNP